MKKILFTLTLIMMMAFSGLCFASDGSDLNKEQKIAENFMGVFTKEQASEYAIVSKDFSDNLKKSVSERTYKKLPAEIKEKFGNVKNIDFRTFEKLGQEDRVTYIASFDKQPVAAIVFIFDQDQKLVNYIFAPIEQQVAE